MLRRCPSEALRTFPRKRQPARATRARDGFALTGASASAQETPEDLAARFDLGRLGFETMALDLESTAARLLTFPGTLCDSPP